MIGRGDLDSIFGPVGVLQPTGDPQRRVEPRRLAQRSRDTQMLAALPAAPVDRALLDHATTLTVERDLRGVASVRVDDGQPGLTVRLPADRAAFEVAAPHQLFAHQLEPVGATLHAHQRRVGQRLGAPDAGRDVHPVAAVWRRASVDDRLVWGRRVRLRPVVRGQAAVNRCVHRGRVRRARVARQGSVERGGLGVVRRVAGGHRCQGPDEAGDEADLGRSVEQTSHGVFPEQVGCYPPGSSQL